MSAGIHPAVLLLLWVASVIVVQPLQMPALLWLALGVLPVCAGRAGRRTWLLVRRARWLLVSIAVLFALSTPGERIPGLAGDLGLTVDGMKLAGEHVLRLLLLLASLALLHQHLGTGGLMTGLHWLLAPLAIGRNLRERIVVRLMLVLNYVEGAPASGWREWLNADITEPERLDLAVASARRLDWALLALLIVLTIMAAWGT